MAQGYIKLEVDPESLNKVKAELHTLYAIADKAAQRIEAAQQSVHPTALRLWQIAWFIQFIAWLITLVFYIGCG